MPLTQMKVYNQIPGAPPLPVGRFMPSDANSALVIRDIQGLGPVKATFQTSPFALARGEFFQGTSVGQRNIVLRVGLNPDYGSDQSMGQLRQQVYRYFMPENQARYEFDTTDLPDSSVHIDGIVESVEPNIFSQDPEMQVSIICPQPDFISDDEVIIGPNNTQPIDDYTEIDYSGTVSNGFDYLEVHSSVSTDTYLGSVKIINDNGPYHFELDIGAAAIFTSPETYFKIITVPTRRRVQQINSDGSTYSLMGQMSMGSSWPILLPGTNQLKVVVASGVLEWTLRYFRRYGGL